ncbi:flagellar basal-body rod protein FlgF [Xanthomonas cucurbitae]|uniref:Flagellar basal-body rod protein FlgF n=1 Tax=Xanthomonas cucurbitae TaxID=56453 RepID=A0ABY7YCV1_9XANT|nr:flagellar basal-body rod protein FlgF [Xanthomonas cucurbitae]WDM67831.1 flagellar basal-body rod protein FlgF [Xanthomonas cucurbitae]WDM71705.1 flagellar basal-body rod protein FlgF [Xanthomonas cucurbitae]
MFQALYNSLSGLFSFSKSLDTVSNNVANMNTPGFRGSDSFFENLAGEHGTRIVGSGLRTSAGDLRQTGNATDVAVNGAGYFVLRDSAGGLHYTRAGQFIFDDRGVLVDSVSRYEVMSISGTGQLSQTNLNGLRTLDAKPTTSVRVSGNLSPTSTGSSVSDIKVYDASGTVHTLKVTTAAPVTSTGSGRTYRVTVTDETGAKVGAGDLRFGTSGMLETGSGSIEATFAAGNGSHKVTLGFGTPGTFTGTTSLSGLTDSLTATVEDGSPVLGINALAFDAQGVLQVTYSSTEKRQGSQLALAAFQSEGTLELASGRMLSNVESQRSELGRAGSSVFGSIQGGSLEMSNIDLTQEFADMLIIQRGYQASSRVMTVSNEMIEQLYNSTRGG